jgi:acetoin utilization protein AcuB
MKVNDWMVRNVITIDPEVGVKDALAVMKKHSVRHLPVVENGAFIGLITSGDVKQAILTCMLETLKVKNVMLTNPYTIRRDNSLEDAARLIYEKNIGCLPVVEDGKVLGILTVNDILKAFIDIMGVLKAGSRMDVILKHVHGSFDEVVSIIAQKGGFIISVGMSLNEDETIHHFRVSGGDIQGMAEELVRLGYRGVKVVD